jgi:GT2 family glycosyltransferase
MSDFPRGSGQMDECYSPAEELDRGFVQVSVVIPVRNGGSDLEACLQALMASSYQDFEVIVVDDGSTDNSMECARRFGARVLRNPSRVGPGASRNAGALVARGSILFFLDADVVPHSDALAKAVARFEANPQLCALFGSYDDRPWAPNFVSVFRNLLHHYVHQQGCFVDEARPAHTFWTGCGAIRRQAFLSLGGFDPKRYRRPAIEDIELGYRITRAGQRIELVRDILATHRKRWSLGSMIKTDIFHRGVPWMLLLLWNRTKENDLNVSRSQRLSVLATGVLIASMAVSPWLPVALGLSAASLLAVFGMNYCFYQYLAVRRGWGFALRSVLLHLVYFLCCGISVAIALGLRLVLTRRGAEKERTKSVDRRDWPRVAQPSHDSKRRVLSRTGQVPR